MTKAESTSLRTYVAVYIALMLLLGLTLGASYLPIGVHLKTWISFAIATAKGALIVAFFMHLRFAGGITRVMASAGIAWLAILFALTLSDYVSRDWLPLPGNWPSQMDLPPPSR